MSRWIKLHSTLNHSRMCFNTLGSKTRFLSNSHDIGMANSSTLEGSALSHNETETAVKSDDEKRAPFGTRYLSDPEKVFEHNAWDNMVWTEEQINDAKKKIEANSQDVLDDEKQELFENEADKFWDEFYSKHQNKFFKDRNWLFKEFPELSTLDQAASSSWLNKVPESRGEPDVDKCQRTSVEENDREDVQEVSEAHQHEQDHITESPGTTQDKMLNAEFPGAWCKRRFLEVGCGVGNTVFPILQVNNDPDLFVYCCDFSSVAIDLVKSNPEYNPERCHGFVLDITDTESSLPFPEGSLDVIILIFVLSAVHPEKMQCAVDRLVSFLKPGGMILLRDYGKYDLAQLRFKPGRCLSDNFYVRGDGTRVYFSTQEELRTMFTTAGLTEEQNLIDRRLQVNRGRQITMYRVWIQCKYRKPGAAST